jgi:hypothetical protein
MSSSPHCPEQKQKVIIGRRNDEKENISLRKYFEFYIDILKSDNGDLKYEWRKTFSFQ